MPHVIIKLHPGRSDEQITGLAEKIAGDVAEIAKCDKKVVSVSVEEVTPEEWSEKVYGPDIMNKQDSLIIRPGYGPLGQD